MHLVFRTFGGVSVPKNGNLVAAQQSGKLLFAEAQWKPRIALSNRIRLPVPSPPLCSLTMFTIPIPATFPLKEAPTVLQMNQNLTEFSIQFILSNA
jgi:hypothetical protein